MSSVAKIVSYNLYGEQVCASSARISTTPGDAIDIFDKSCAKDNNQSLIEKVLKSGHTSILEHIVFSIAFCNVSAVVEQYFIECRLASFTVKSRRYVDYRNQGYYVPPELEDGNKELYIEYMNNLYRGYQLLVDNGAPKEDARFLLPYSFNSNFYCTINARELIHVRESILHGRGGQIDELKALMGQIIDQLNTICPVINKIETNLALYTVNKKSEIQLPEEWYFIDESKAGLIEFERIPSQINRIIEKAYKIGHPTSNSIPNYQELIKSNRLRELEQLNYTFLFKDVSLSGITHLVRHRMQSIIVPPLTDILPNKFILPDSIKKDYKSYQIYTNAIETASELRRSVMSSSELSKYLYYFIISGNTTDVMTTMNMRELMTFIRLRSCNRAQWEVRHIANRIIKDLRTTSEELYYLFGPACYMYGYCPEGRLSCGKMEEVVKSFRRSTTESFR